MKKGQSLLIGVFASLVLVLSGLVFSCAGKSSGALGKSLTVSILPQAYFVERIGSGRVKPLVLVGPGQSPHSYEPSPKQMEGLAKSLGWLTIDMEFEHALLPKVSSLYPSLAVLDGTEGMVFRSLEEHSHEDEEGEVHEEGEEHEEGEHLEERDPHVWLGRKNAQALALNTLTALVSLDPEGKASYEKAYAALSADIDKTFDDLVPQLAQLRGKPVFVFHPAFGYFLDEFGIEQKAVEISGKEPTQQALADLIAEAKAEGVSVIFVQKQFPTTAAQTIAKAINGQVIGIDDLAENWLDNLRDLGSALAKAGK